MARKRYSPEEIIGKLRSAEVWLAEGASVADVVRRLGDEFGISLSETTMSREMRALGLRKLSARPRHYAHNEIAVDAFKKTSPPRWRKSRRPSTPA